MSRLVLRTAAILVATVTLAAGEQVAPRTPVTTTAGTATRSVVPRAATGARTHGFTTIQGNALDSANAQMPNVIVRLRDARFGQIVDTELTDAAGLFEFRAVDPGSYIVEIMGSDSSVLAASQILSVDAGEIVSAIVKLPFKVPAFAGMFGTSSAQTAAAVMTTAAANGVVAVIATDPVSPIE